MWQPTIQAPGPPCSLPIQVVLTLYPTPLDVIRDFDVDCCCFAFIPAMEKVVTTKRGLRALKYGVNLCDSSFDSPSYCRRLEKYAWRGFLVGVPGFEAHTLPRTVLESNYTYHEKHDVLLRLGPVLPTPIPAVHIGATDAVQDCAPARHFERLAVLAYARHKVRVRPIHTSLVGRGTVLYHGDETDSDEEYSSVPDAAVRSLLERRQQDEAAALTGGVIAKWARIRRDDGARRLLDETTKRGVAAHITSRAQLQCVYDFCRSTTPFSALQYVLDAARPPLAAIDAFKRAYGIDRVLTFCEARGRARAQNDWWSVYE